MTMNGERRRRMQIGLLVSHLEDEFDSAVCEGAMIAAQQADVNLVIIPGRYINGVYADKLRTEYEYQYNTLFDLPVYNKFDLLLVLAGTISSHLTAEQKKVFLERFDGTPVITIASKIEGYPCVAVDNTTGLKAAIEHLINTHGCTRLGFVSGPKTSDDALERLAVYKSVLEENGIEYDENRVVYGNFSRYVTPQVRELLDRCQDLEAIVFANDQMASAGYKVMEERGIRPGTDILVTGFDDDIIAEELVPHLTTVKADAAELGYSALMESVNYLNNGILEHDKIPSSMVCRNSCGCTGNPRLGSMMVKADENNIDESINALCAFMFNKYRTSEETRRLASEFAELLKKIDEYIGEENLHDRHKRTDIANMLDSLLSEEFFRYVTLDNLYSVMEHIHSQHTRLNEDRDNQLMINRLFVQLYKIVAERNAAYSKLKLEDNHFLMWQTNSITRDMLVFEAYDDRSYQTVVDKLTRLHMRSSYLYSYDKPIINRKTDSWQLPPTIKLKSYHNCGEAVTLPEDGQDIPSDKLFSNQYLPNDRRYTLVASALFSNEEHYGLLLCEIDHEYFRHIQSVTVQLCAALKIISLMKREASVQLKLQQSLIEIKENNQLLSELSNQDELTGCYNRRGFFEEVRRQLRDEDKFGKTATMIFADLDSLKIINDRFGHEEGDFAIRSAAKILENAFSDDEIVGRIGGDEFVVFSYLGGDMSITKIRELIEKAGSEYNAAHCADKPYIIHTSVGVYTFRCTATVEIGELLSHADALLYEQKKRKKQIIKSKCE